MRRPGQPTVGLVVVVVGQHVGAFEPLQLQPVLQQPQELVRRSHVGGVVTPDVSALTESGQRIDGRSHMQRVIVTPMHQLQELDCEFDIAQPSGAKFDLTGTHTGRYQFFDPPTHRLHFRNEIRTVTGGPHHRHQGLDIRPAQFGITGGGPCLQQGLELPGFGPALIVGDVRFECPNQLSAFTFRTQRGIDLEEGVGCEPHHLTGNPGRGGQVIAGVLPDEDDVDIADVVEFARTALAHRDDGETGRRPLCTDGAGGHGQRRLQRRIGQVRQVCHHLDEGQHRLVLDGRGHVERGQHQQPVPVQVAQRRHGAAHTPVDLDGTGRLDEGGAQLFTSGKVDVAGQQPPRLWVCHNMITERQRRSEHPQQPASQWSIGQQPAVELRPIGLTRVCQAPQGQQCGIGVGRPGQRPQQLDMRLGVPAEPVQFRRGLWMHQPEPTRTGQFRAVGRGFCHAHDGTAPRTDMAAESTATGRSSARTA